LKVLHLANERLITLTRLNPVDLFVAEFRDPGTCPQNGFLGSLNPAENSKNRQKLTHFQFHVSLIIKDFIIA